MSKISQIKEQIESLQKELQTLKKVCKHTRVIYNHGSNTGNYDPSADCYWLDVECIDCGKRMTYDAETDRENYSLKGVVGSEVKLKKEDYESFLKIQKELQS